MNKKVTCKYCGYENPINYNICINCNKNMGNYSYFKNDFKKYYQLFSETNLKVLEEIPLTDTAYDTILNSIIEIGSINLHSIPEVPSIPNLIKITKPYAKVQYDQKKKHPEFFSYYSFNQIFINRNTPSNMINGAIIHEFSHHLFNEIIKQSIMHLLNMEKNLYIESFAWYLTLQNEYLKIANEYISHKTQEYFFPEQFGGYTSLIKLLEESSNLDESKIQIALDFASVISNDIIFILEHYITKSNMANSFNIQNNNLPYIIHDLSQQSKINAIYTIIYKTFELFCTKKRDMLPILDSLNNSYIHYNV